MTEEQPSKGYIGITAYLPPLWSFGLMIVLVGLCVCATLGAIIVLGGRQTPPPTTPQLELLQAQPNESLPTQTVLPTLPPS